MVAFIAVLMFMATVDEDIGEVEEHYLRRVCAGNAQLYQAAVLYHNSHTFDELLRTFPPVDEQQKLCVLANMTEVGMSDGVLHTSEQDLIQEFASHMSLREADVQAVNDILLLKNQLSVFAP